MCLLGNEGMVHCLENKNVKICVSSTVDFLTNSHETYSYKIHFNVVSTET